jgi:hypothetical protein
MTIIQRAIPHGFNHWRPLFWSASLALLVSPLIAMQFTREVDWDRIDFLSAAVLLLLTGAAIELAIRSIPRPALRSIAIIGVIVCAALVWADAAVGVF